MEKEVQENNAVKQFLKSQNITLQLILNLEKERDRFLTIAYNAICLGQLNEIYDEKRLLSELGCSKAEYDKIMEG